MIPDGLTDKASGAATATRLLRLLSLYRIVVGIALASMVYPGSGPISSSLAAAAAYSGVSLLNFMLIPRLRAHLPSLLLALLGIDLAFIGLVLIATTGVTAASGAFLLPAIAAHAYLLPTRMAFAHAALATMLLLLAEWLLRSISTASLFVTAIIGAGFFLVAAIGRVLGRNLSDLKALAEQREEDVRRLAHVNELVIHELEHGVLVVNAAGEILLANPQARRWLVGDEAMLLQGKDLCRLCPELAVEWERFVAQPQLWDPQPITLTRPRVTVLPRMMPVALASGDTLILLEDAQTIEQQAQQLKLAALGRLSASIAHEIRNPLSAIKQAAQLLAESTHSSSQAGSLSRIIDKNTERIDRIIRDVSLLGRRDRGSPRAIPLGERLPELIEEIGKMISAPTDWLQLELYEPCVVQVDAGHLEAMLTNLLTNAWRHSQQKAGSVRVQVRPAESSGRAALHVIDDGTGVPEAMREHLFEPFASGSGSTGLGLYIVRELARANGGRIRLAASSSKAEGAHFILELPLATESETHA